MELRARAIVFWPGITADIHAVRAECVSCNRHAPSQPSLPSAETSPPTTPFEAVYADFFDFAGKHYLVVGDRLSGWTEVFVCTPGSSQAGAAGLVGCLRSLFGTFGVPVELSSDGGPEFVSGTTRDFLKRWGVNHRVSSAYNPQSNGRAEVAVKATKRLLRSNINPNGSLDNDRFLRALLQQRNTPDPDCDISPAQIVFGKPLRDSLAFVNRLEKFSNPHVLPTWRDAWSMKEACLRTRYTRSREALDAHSRPQSQLHVGDKCFVQNGAGNHPTMWDRTGTVMEVLDHDKYCIKIDGSGRVTTRNRKLLRQFTPASSEITPGTAISLPPAPATNQPSSSSPVDYQSPPPSSPIKRQPPVETSQYEDEWPLPAPPRQATTVSSPRRAPVPLPPAHTPCAPPAVLPESLTASQQTLPTTERPRRATRKPAWQESDDWLLSE